MALVDWLCVGANRVSLDVSGSGSSVGVREPFGGGVADCSSSTIQQYRFIEQTLLDRSDAFFSAALFIAAMAPALAQIRVALARAHATMGRGIRWTDVLSYLALGMPWMDEAHHNPANPAGSNSPCCSGSGSLRFLF